MAAGDSTDVSFNAHNLGTVSDTFLLDVEVQPDLAAWWANHTNTTSGNSSQAVHWTGDIIPRRKPSAHVTFFLVQVIAEAQRYLQQSQSPTNETYIGHVSVGEAERDMYLSALAPGDV